MGKTRDRFKKIRDTKGIFHASSVQFSCSSPTLCSLMDCSMPGFPVHHQLLESARIHVHRVGDTNHLILCRPLLLPSILPSIMVFSNESVLGIRWSKYCNLSISPSHEYSGLISFRMDWLDLLAVRGTLKSLLQHHNSKASILQCSVFIMVQLSHPYMTTGKTIALTRQTFVSKVISLLFNMLSSLVISFSSKEQASLNFMAAVTICSDFGAQENSLSLFTLFPHPFA